MHFITRKPWLFNLTSRMRHYGEHSTTKVDFTRLSMRPAKAGLMVTACVVIALSLIDVRGIFPYDFAINYVAVHRWQRGVVSNIYNINELRSYCGDVFLPDSPHHLFTDVFNTFVSSPCTVFFYYPLTWFRFTLASRLWFWLNIILILWTCYLLAQKNELLMLVTAILCVSYPPLRYSLYLGQISVILLWGFAVLLWGINNKKYTLASLSLSGLMAVKIFPLLMLPLCFFGLLKKKRAWLILPGALLLIAGALLIGIEPFLYWIEEILPALSHGEHSYYNQSLNSFLCHLMADSFTGDCLGRIVSLILLCTAYGLMYLLHISEHRANDDEDFQCALNFMLVSLLLAIPLCWIHYLTILIIPFSYLAKQVLHPLGPVFSMKRLFSFATLCICFIFLAFRPTPLAFRAGLHSFPFSSTSPMSSFQGTLSLLILYAYFTVIIINQIRRKTEAFTPRPLFQPLPRVKAIGQLICAVFHFSRITAKFR